MRTQTMVQLTDELVGRLDERAARQGVSRSALIRKAVEAFLDHDRERERVERFAEAYARVPETAQELEVAHASAAALVGEEPWDPPW